jgi:hypothetical protein
MRQRIQFGFLLLLLAISCRAFAQAQDSPAVLAGSIRSAFISTQKSAQTRMSVLLKTGARLTFARGGNRKLQ